MYDPVDVLYAEGVEVSNSTVSLTPCLHARFSEMKYLEEAFKTAAEYGLFIENLWNEAFGATPKHPSMLLIKTKTPVDALKAKESLVCTRYVFLTFR